MSSEFFVEAGQYQQAAIEEMERRAFNVQRMHPDKTRATTRRCALYQEWDCEPGHGCEELLAQLLGAEKHDDLGDALLWLTLGSRRRCNRGAQVHYE